MTELAILAPVLIFIVLCSQAFTDEWIVRLKGQEATRFALWQTTTMQDKGAVLAATQARYAMLRGDERAGVTHGDTGLLTFPARAGVGVDPSSSVETHLKTEFPTVSVRPPPAHGIIGGIIGLFMSFFQSWATGAVHPALDFFKFDRNGTATAHVDVFAHEALFHPLAQPIFGVDFSGAGAGNFHSRAEQQELTYDTWKAWPSPYHIQHDRPSEVTDTSESPAATYHVVQRNVSTQVKHMVYFGVTNIPLFGVVVSLIDGLFSNVLGLPSLVNTQHLNEEDRSGPIGIHKVDELRNQHYTVPYKIKVGAWTSEPGPGSTSAHGSPIKMANKNPYVDSYTCRGDFYLGAKSGQAPDDSGPNWGGKKWRGCK